MRRALDELVQEMNHYFYSRKTYDLDQRIQTLKALKKRILQSQDAIVQSLYTDFKKTAMEVYTSEILMIIEQINETLKHLKSWAKPKTYGSVLPIIGGQTQILKEPYGVCVIFAPYNYPFALAMTPLIGAIAAGNCAIIKPSEYTPATNKVLKKIIRQVFPPYHVSIVEGGPQTAQKLLNLPIDYIFFTGSTQTGKKIMSQAAQHLIPVTLELGGKSPVIVDQTADLQLAAKRIVWGKFLNAGQTCIAPDYVLVQKQVARPFLKALKQAIQTLYKRPFHEMAHIINESQYVRLLQLIDEDKIYFGGHFHTDSLYIEPTLLYPVQEHDLCMQEEIFGPILPIIPYEHLKEAIYFVQRRPKPLAVYCFSQSQPAIDYLLKHLSFGGGCINDTLLHATHNKAPFGGVGYSGMGAYHGAYSFETFSHEKTVFISSPLELPFRKAPSNQLLKAVKKMIR